MLTEDVLGAIIVEISPVSSIRHMESQSVKHFRTTDLNFRNFYTGWDFKFLRGVTTEVVLGTAFAPTWPAGCFVTIFEINNGSIEEATDSRINGSGSLYCLHC